MPCEDAKETIPSPPLKLYDPFEGSVASHFISLPGVTMSNCVAARFVMVELLTMLPVSSVPKYRPPSAEAAALSVVPAAVAGPAATTANAVAAAAAVASAARARGPPRERVSDLRKDMWVPSQAIACGIALTHPPRDGVEAPRKGV